MNENGNMRMLDLFSGLGGASRAMVDAGWEVITVDNNPAFNPTICADILTWNYQGPPVDLLWASPPCQEFTRKSMPWLKKNHPEEPSLELLKATIRIIGEVKPRYWVIENVRGAIPYFRPFLGEPTKRSGPRILWGEFPPIDPEPVWKYIERHPSKKKRTMDAAKIPYNLSRALCRALTR